MPDWFLEFWGLAGLNRTNELSKELIRKQLMSVGSGSVTDDFEDIRDGYYLDPGIHRRLAEAAAAQ